MTPLRILITNITLASRTGTECYVRDLATALLRRGHQPVVYSARLGALAEELRTATVPVVADLDRVGASPDLIHGHHFIPTLTALHHFPSVPGVLVCHDRLAWHDTPLVFPRLLRHVAVDDNCRDRLVLEGGLPESRVRTLLNWVDLERCRPRGPLPTTPQRALFFGRAEGPLAAVRAACRSAGVALDMLGAAQAIADPERVLRQYDVVFAKGRSALEALAVGCAVVLCGVERVGPLVTPANFDRLRPLNFGMRAIQWPAEAEIVLEQLRGYDPAAAALVSARVRAEAGLDPAVDALLALYFEVLAEWRAAPPPDPVGEGRATARALATLDVLSAQLGEQAARSGAISHELHRLLTTDDPMPALEDEDARLLSLHAGDVPAQMAPGGTFRVEVRLENRSGRVISSGAPWPVYIAARWWNADGQAVLVDDGLRTRLEPPLEPLAEGRYRALLRAPESVGAYRVRLSLVQELRCWFDHLEALCHEAVVVVC